jgi:formate/nitrite transporter FocA (FNT family)
VGNAIGAFALGILCHFIFINVPDIATRIEAISVAKTASKFVFLEGIFCGALVYIAVYCYKNFQNWGMKIIGIIVAVTLFVYCGFQHCIANMFYFGMAFNWNIDMLWNLLLVILTNSIGALLVRCIVHLTAIIVAKKEN